MAEHFLADFVADVERQPSKPWYNSHGDCIVCQLDEDVAVVADRVDELLTIYRAADTRKAVGFQIKGVRAIAAKFGWDAIAFSAETSDMGIKKICVASLVLAAYEDGPLTMLRRQGYAEAMSSCSSACEVPVGEQEYCYA